MWATSIGNDEQLHSILFFLSDSLRSALEGGEFLNTSDCEPPDITPEINADEIASRLASFRGKLNGFKAHEAIVVTKVARARDWSLKLRKLQPTLKTEIDGFRHATACCEDLQNSLRPSVQQVFHGGYQPRRFLQRRVRRRRTSPVMQANPALAAEKSFFLAGKVDSQELLQACEDFLVFLQARYKLLGLDLAEIAPAAETVAENEPPVLDDCLALKIDDIVPEPALLSIKAEDSAPVAEKSTAAGAVQEFAALAPPAAGPLAAGPLAAGPLAYDPATEPLKRPARMRRRLLPRQPGRRLRKKPPLPKKARPPSGAERCLSKGVKRMPQGGARAVMPTRHPMPRAEQKIVRGKVHGQARKRR